MNRRLVLVSGIVLLAGCASPPRLLTSPEAAYPELEPLLSARAGREALHIEVISNGCTRKEDFVFHLAPRGGGQGLAIARKRLDACRAAPRSMARSFSWRDLGVEPGAEVVLLNPVGGAR
ncbi:MAG: hypothetical protein ACK41C_18810 [Phenylobacterium sp.]|uniref:hypothetical protein n=1 Tax=Phenylobacterium sp. TaxID=1871053 RepID=UPI00391AC2F7